MTLCKMKNGAQCECQPDEGFECPFDKHKGCVRAFTQLSRAWYCKAVMTFESDDFVDRIMLGYYHPEGGTTGEFQVEWVRLGGKIIPRMSVFDDAWDALWKCRDVLEKMAFFDDKAITPDTFCSLLKSCGFVDSTEEIEKH